jgi:CubicO group peptidase (beta-lactamase class C family)
MTFSTKTRFAALSALAAAATLACAPPPPPPAPLPAPPPPVAGPAMLPAEAQARAYLAAFDSGDRATLKAFLEKAWPKELEHLDEEMEFREMTGGFELKQIEVRTPSRFVALIKERASDQIARLEVEVAPDEAHLVTKLDADAIPTPPELAVPRLREAEALAALGAALEKAAKEDHFSGAALVAKGGKVIFSHAYGLASREARAENQLTTQFRIGSMNKMFTAVAVLQLVQAGKIKLDAPLGTYLPDYPNKDVARKVTIHHLLTHTGGTGDIFGPDFDAHRLELKALKDYVALYGARAPEFEPGTKWRYSNYGFLLLGAVIEKVSGRSYYDHVRERVFTPAGMRSTDSLPEDTAVAARSVGYTKRGAKSGGWQPNTATLPYRGTSAGGGYSTVEDLLRFATALQANVLLDAKHTELLVTPKASPGAERQYGYGIATEERSGMRCFGHGGGAPGMTGDLEICPKEGYVVAVLANLDPPAAGRIAEFLLNRLPLK